MLLSVVVSSLHLPQNPATRATDKDQAAGPHFTGFKINALASLVSQD